MNRLQIIKAELPAAFCVPADKNIMFYSEVQKADMENVFNGFSIKYIYQGTSFYQIQSGGYRLTKNTALVAPQQPGKVCFEESSDVIALCIYVNDRLVRQCYHLRLDQPELDNLLDDYFTYPLFFEKKYHADEAGYLGQLNHLASQVHDGYEPVIDEDWFYQLTEKIVDQELGTAQSVSAISAVKNSTRKEIFKRLMVAKQYMDEISPSCPGIENIARHAALSEFHFFRSFREAFCESPFQYMQSLRLEKAKQWLIKGEMNVSEIAIACTFPDTSTFSKAFKRKFGMAPSRVSEL